MDAVKAGLQRLAGSTYSYTVTGDYWRGQKYSASGSHDAKARKDSRSYKISGGPEATSRKVIVIGDDSYASADGASRWTHADLTRLKPTSAVRFADPKDPGGLNRLLAALHSARAGAPRSYEGSARLEVTRDALTYLPPGAPIFRFAQGGQWASYTVTMDAKGDITSIKSGFETADGGVLSTTTTFSRIGQPVRIVKPTRVTELPSSQYRK